MNTTIKKMALGTLMTVGFLLTGCSQEGGYSAPGKAPTTEKSAPLTNLKIVKWGPQNTKQGVVFNAQPDGSAALWIQLNQSLEGTDSVVVMDGANLTSAISGNLITANVPASFYAKTGVHSLRVDTRSGATAGHSDAVNFVVD